MTLHEIATNHMESSRAETYFSNHKFNLIHVLSGDYCFYLFMDGKARYPASFGPDELADRTWFLCDKKGKPKPSGSHKCTGPGRSCSGAASQA